ncbi:thiol:disulfide interchange protein DsbD [Chromohalobacter marismortui]|uniref:Thiol:disulfide interchange protein DsbD n=1 Tax=Chromohalobacter marismortui TaxID=42055 RepID=A0A4R7NJM7_9GAMM|nr:MULTISPECIES: protein-disulfide reductase DsbD [Chromohalobacter]MCI0511560.1 protein-disulfide reductase DsbD [Chromohalobacter sp.]MCI0594485.1 protein-disulfide reductase DsbD [Chromohalobacter sp.]TDU20501.1 thiol:disulfide interchange protein DsbD [Chromohalobacter marismortui]
MIQELRWSPRPAHALHRWFVIVLGAITLIVTLPAQADSPFASQDEFLSAEQAFSLSLSHKNDKLVAQWDIAPGYYLYRKRFQVATEEGAVTPDLPEGETIEDEYFGRSEIYRYAVTLRAVLGDADRVTLTWQGCADAGLCYPPQRQTFDAESLEPLGPASVAGDAAVTDSPTDASARDTHGTRATSVPDSRQNERQVAASTQGEDQRLAAQLADARLGWVIAAFFGMGLLLTFTPCVLPMVPILSSLIVGATRDGRPRMRDGAMLSLAYILPMATTYAGLGVAAALAGANLQMLFQAPAFIVSFAALFVLLALAMFGAFELALPGRLQTRLDAWMTRQRGGRLGGAAVMGVLSALLVGPCMTAPLAGALLYIADSGDAWQGGLALWSLGLGMGAPLLAVGLLGPRILPRPGPWMNRVRIVFGFVLLGMAIWFAARVLPPALELAAWGALLVGLAQAAWQAARTLRDALAPLSRSIAILLALWGVLMIVGAASGQHDPLRPLAGFTGNGDASTSAEASSPLAFETVADQAALDTRLDQARAQQRWTLVEFTADWCISCEIIADNVFGDARVQAALDDVQRLRIDVTDNDAEDRAIMQALGVVGPPTLLLYGPDGIERRESRIIGELSAEEFLERLAAARTATASAKEA